MKSEAGKVGKRARGESDVAIGTLRKTGKGKYFAQYSIGPNTRAGTTLYTCKTDDEAQRRRLAIAQLVVRLREAGYLAMIPNIVKKAGAVDDEEFKTLAEVVERVASGKDPALARTLGARREGTTVRGARAPWTTGKLAERFPDHVRVKKTSGDDRRILEWLSKVRMPDGTTFGDRVVASISLDDLDHVMGALPKTAESPASRRHYAQSLRKLLVYAVYPLRLLPTLPIPKGWLPKNRSDKAKAWVYPSEDLALMRCTKVPIARRVFYGFLVREGMRVSEALALTWTDLDLVRGVVRLDTNKTDDPRSWVLGEDVARALKAWKAMRGAKAKKNPRVFPLALLGDRGDLAQHLRDGLKLAGVKRPELLVPKPGRILLRAHDLRGSLVTLALAEGRTEAWVTDRTGHKSSQMIYLYKRASRTAAELGLGWFAPLDEAIPSWLRRVARVQTGCKRGVRGALSRPEVDHETSGNTSLRYPSGASIRAF